MMPPNRTSTEDSSQTAEVAPDTGQSDLASVPAHGGARRTPQPEHENAPEFVFQSGTASKSCARTLPAPISLSPFGGEDPDPRQLVCFPSLEALDSSKIRLWSTTQFRLRVVMAKGFWPSTCQSFPDFPVSGLGVAQTP